MKMKRKFVNEWQIEWLMKFGGFSDYSVMQRLEASERNDIIKYMLWLLLLKCKLKL